MTNRPKTKPSSGAEITPTRRYFFTQLKNSAQISLQPSAADYTIHNAVAAVPIEQTKPLDRSTSSAEITLHGRQRFTQLKMFASKALHPSGKKGDLINGLAAIQVEQTRILNRVGLFSLDEPITDGSGQDQDILILDRGDSPNLSTVPRQDTAASQEDTATLVETSSLSSLSILSTESFQQTAIINFSSIPHTRSEITLVQQPFKSTFLDNIAPPFFRTPLPELNKRFTSTLQLAFGRHILLTKKTSLPSPMPDSLSTVEDDIQAIGLEGTDRLWMSAISKNPIEQDRLRWLIAQVVFQFLKSNHKDAMSIAEVTLLGSVLDRQDYRGVLSSLIGQLEQEPLLDSELLLGLVYFLQSASPGYLIDDDLVKILRVLRRRLEETHMQLGDTKKPASKHIYLLVIAVSRVLDTMVEGNVKGLNRTEDHRPLLDILAGLKDSPDLYLKYQATYAWQALQYIGDDESPLNMALRVGGGLVMAGLGVASAFKLDIGGLFSGLRELGEAVGQVLDATKTVVESAQTARDAGEGVVDSLLKGFRTGDKRAWYPALQGARVFIREGRLAEFKRVVYEAPCRRELEFQWGVCQLLGEMAMDPIWGTEICQQAVYLLEDLHRYNSGWTKDSSVREAIRGILLRISKSAEKIPIHVNSLSQDSRWDNGDNSAEPYPLITRLPIPESSLLLAKVLKIPSLEYDLHRIMAQRLKAHQQAVYIPPYAKANLKASDDEYFPLMEKVMEFLESDRQVFLILGNSGSGKSTFNRHLDYVLTKDYNQGSPIPIFIYLPTIRNPGTGLISEHLKTLNFTDDDIQELKRDRQFIIICDSYDESRLSINLHTSNMLNRPDQWNAKMIISCRSTHARRDYLDRFQPQPLDRYGPSTSHLFQEAAIVPFSEGQIKDYVDQFVRDTEVHKLLGGRSAWSAAEYMDKLTRIPNLLPLVTNPFLLNLSLRSLPVVFKDDLDPSTITITRPKLFGIFIDEWLEVNRQRLMSMDHSEAAKTKLDELFEGGFKQIAIDFLEDLATTIYKEQAGHSVVKYIHRLDKETWKAKFFGPDEEVTLLRQSSPLTCVENLHSFIHRSLLEYSCSLQMARLTPPTNKRENGQHEHTPRISQTNNQQTNLSQGHPTPNDQCEQGNLLSPSATPSPSENTHNRMPLSIPNASDPGSSLSSSNFPSNTSKRVTSKDACDDTTLDAESDGSVSSDDEFEDAHEFISSDPSECITQSAPTSKLAVPTGTSWFRRLVTVTGASVVGAGAVAIGAGAPAVGAVHDAASGAGHAAHGALENVDGVWKRTVQVLTTRKAHVDAVAPIAKTSYVYYDDEIYDAVLTEKSTGITYVIQLLFDSSINKYYVYIRWGETDYKLDGPHETIESAKTAFKITYHDKFGVKWEQREIVVSERFSYEIQTHETFETIEEIEEIVEETEAIAIITREEKKETEEQTITTETTTTTTTTQEEVVLDHVEKEVIVDKKVDVMVEKEVEVDVDVDVTIEKKVDIDVDVEVEVEKKETIIVKESGKVEKTAVPSGTSWFRRIATATGAAVVGTGAVAAGAVHGAASGAGHVAHGALEKVDGVWKRTVQVLTTRKAHVDAVAPIAKTSYVYYDDEVYDAVLTEKSTGITYVTQLLFDSSINKYYVYIRWGETDYKLDGPHETIESAKDAFQVTYHEKFGVQWQERETTVSERFTYEIQTHETFETTEDFEEIIEETEAIAIITREEKKETEEQIITTETTTTTQEEVVLEHVKKDDIVDKKVDIDADVEADVVDVEKVQVDAEPEVEIVDNEVKEVVEVDVEVAPSPSLPECKISGIPASLGDLTTESLVSEMSASPVFDDQSLGAMDLEEEPDILQFLVDRVHEDPDYTKLLLWTVYKSGAEGIVNQSTKNATYILEMAGIHFQLQV